MLSEQWLRKKLEDSRFRVAYALGIRRQSLRQVEKYGQLLTKANEQAARLSLIADTAADLVLLWQQQKIAGLPRSERNAAIEDVRNRLIDAVTEWQATELPPQPDDLD